MAGRAAQAALDEIQWRSPADAASMGGISSDTVLHYFARSPYFDPTSNNAILVSQLQFNEGMRHILASRALMEDRLKTMSGLEFMVAQAPAEDGAGMGTGVWVIRKQTRRKRSGFEDEVTVHSTYYVVNDNIYMGATVGDIVGNSLLHVISLLNGFFGKASTLPDFTPALGHTYPTPATKSKITDTGIRSVSKEATPMPDSLGSIPKTRNLPTTTNNSTYHSALLLRESINMSMQYGDEYMDDNPITGQPGDFHFSNTGRNKDKDKLVVPAVSKGVTGAGSIARKESAPPTPVIETKTVEMPGKEKDRKSSKGDKSPRTPGMPKPKRRKSKNVMSGGATPK